MDHSKKKAAIIIGDKYMSDPTKELECDVYYFPEDITELELAEEIRNLIEFYDDLIYPIFWPPHLRGDKIIAWIKKCQEGTQCNIFCKNYEKGCMLNATE